MASANRDILTSSFPIHTPFIYSSCVITLARNSNITLNMSEKSGHHCLVPEFRGNYFFFSPFSKMSAWGLSYIVYYLEIHSFYSQFHHSFYHKKDIEFCQRISLYLLRWLCDLCSSFCLYVELYLLIFVCWATLHLWNEINVITVYDPFEMLLNAVCQYIENFCP
jgi:hypothetical protein